jgi:hypothetical protein
VTANNGHPRASNLVEDLPNRSNRELALDFVSTQRYCCVVIPDYDDHGNLPPGIHEALWSEIEERFGINSHRRRLLDGLFRAARILKSVGCKRLYLDGGFATLKTVPQDFDGCWESTGVDINELARIEPALVTFDPRRTTQKLKFGGELFLAEFMADSTGRTYLEFFQVDRDGNKKGIILMDLRRLDD